MCLNCALKVPVTVPDSVPVVKGVVVVLTNTPASDVHCSECTFLRGLTIFGDTDNASDISYKVRSMPFSSHPGEAI